MGTDPVTFLATFKPIQSAVRLDGQGDGGELVLTFDKKQMAEVLRAWALYAGKLMQVTCEAEDGRRESKR